MHIDIGSFFKTILAPRLSYKQRFQQAEGGYEFSLSWNVINLALESDCEAFIMPLWDAFRLFKNVLFPLRVRKTLKILPYERASEAIMYESSDEFYGDISFLCCFFHCHGHEVVVLAVDDVHRQRLSSGWLALPCVCEWVCNNRRQNELLIIKVGYYGR